MASKEELLKRAQMTKQVYNEKKGPIKSTGPTKTKEELLKSAKAKRAVTQDDVNQLDSFFRSTKNYLSNLEKDTMSINLKNATDVYNKYASERDSFLQQANAAKYMLNFLDIDETKRQGMLYDIDEMVDKINKVVDGAQEGEESLKSLSDFYSQFANEEEYKQSMEFSELSSDEKKAYIEKRKKDAEYFGKILDRYERSKYENYSIDIGESPVAGPQGLIKELEAVGIGTGDLQIVNGDVQKFEEDAYKKYEQIKAEIGSYESTMEALKFAQNVSDFKEKLTTDGLVAEWEQSGSKDYSAHLSNSSEMFEDEKIVYNVLARRAGQIINVYDDGRIEIADGKYVKLYKKQQRKGLTDSEMALQIGITTKEYKEKVADAAEFVEFKKKLEDYANQRKGIKIAESLDGKLLLQELYGIVSGAETWLSGMQSLVTGESKNSATDYASALIKEDIKSGYGVWSPFWGGVYDTNVSIGQMVPSIAISYVVGGAAGALGASTKGAQLAGNIAFKTSFGGSVYGNAYTEMINAGYKPTQAKTFASLSAASEVFLQDMLGGIGKFSGKLTNVSIKAVADNIDNAFARIAVSGVLEGLGEFTEESLQEILNPIYKSIITGNVEPIDWGNVLYSGILGFATSAVMNGPGYVKQGVSTAISKWKQNEFKITKKGVKLLNVSEEVYSLANSMPEYTTSYKLSEIVRKKGNAYNLVSELAYLEKPITDDVANTIKSNLLNEGYSEEVASGLVNSLKKVSSGGNVTTLQKQAIEFNPILSSLILDAFTKADATKLGIKEQYDNIYSRKETTREAIYDKISSKLGQNTGEMKATDKKALKTRTQNTNTPISDVVLSKKKNPELTDSEIAKNKQIIIDVGEALGYKVEFEEQVYTESGAVAQGKIDYESNVIKISETAEKPIAWIFKHEITHSVEKSNNYEQFVDKIAQTDVYNHWLRMQTGLNSSTNAMEKALIKSTINKYSNAGVDLDELGSRGEIIADFIGDMLFTDPDALQDMLEQLDKPTRNKLVKWILELIDKIKAKFSKGDDKIYNELEALERRFADMLKDVGTDSVENNLSKSDVKYSYAGEKAKTVNMANLQAAVDMEESGKFTVNKIRKTTGWFRGYDGKWRFEIDDSKMQVKDVMFKDSGMTLGDIIEHEELFDAYPQLKDIKIEISYDEKFNEKIGATYDPINKKIMLNGRFFDPQGKIWAENEVLFKPTLIHEIQHVIQEIEGFAGGASTAYWEFYKEHQLPSENNGLIELVIEYNTILDKVAQYNESGSNKLIEYYNLKIDEQPTTMSIKSIEQQKELVECEKALKQLGLENEYQQASLLIDKMNNTYKKMRRRQQRSAEDLYKHTAGEIEAKDVENRLEYNKKERYDVSPNVDMPDVVFSEKEDIIRLLKNGNVTSDNLQNIEEDASEISERKFSYKELISKPDMQVKTVSNVSPAEFKRYKEDTGIFAKDMRKIAADVGNKKNTPTTTYLYCKDLDANVLITKECFKHGAERFDGAYVAVCKSIAEILYNSIVVNELKERANTNGSYVLLGLVQNADDYILVRSVISKKTWKLEEYNELYAIKKKSVKKEDVGLKPPHYTQKSGFGTSSSISIADFLKFVNRQNLGNSVLSADVVSALNTSRGFDENISPYLKYSLPETKSALKTENEKLKADNKNLRELVDLYKHTAGGEIKIVSVDKVARDLIKRNNIKGDKTELIRKLINLYKFISRGEDLSWENIKQKAAPVVKWLQEHVREESNIDEYSRDILDALRNTKVYLDEAQRKEVSAQFGAYGDFRKRLMGSVIIANKENAHTSLDQAWQELAEMYPDVFDAKTAPNDMPGMLFETVQMLRNGDFSVEQEQRYYNEAEKADLLNQVYEGYWDVSDVKTASEIMQNKLDALKIKHAKQMKSLRTDKNKRIESIKAETQNKMREGRKKTETRQKIKRVVNTLNSYLLNGNKNKHVPEWMQPAVAEALDLINMDTIGAQERIDNLRAKLKENLSESERANIEKSIANIHEMGERLNIRLIKLKNAYAEIQAAEDPLLAGSFDEVVENKIQEIIDNVGDTSIRKMTLQQLESVYDMFSMILTRVRDVNKAFTQNQKETITEMGQNVVSEIKSAGGEKEKQRVFVAQIKKFGWDLFKPIYAMRAIGSDTFTKLFQNIINGQGVWARDMEESKKFISHQKKKYGYSKWDFKKTYTFKSRTDSKFNLNLEQIMSIYAYSKRPQAHDHLMKGGITFAKDAITEVKNKMGIVEKYKVNTSKAYNLDPQTIIDIVSVLTEQQRQYVDVMQSYLSDIMGEKGNDVSMKLYGIKLFKEKFYFPLKSANYFITYEAGQTQEKRIKNSGMTKKTVAHANNPIVLDDFSKVWASHVNEMSMYHSFVLPLEDFNRVFNYRTPSTTETETLSVASTLVNTYGDGAEDYIKTLLSDLNGGVRSDGSALMDKLISLSKKGAVMASASVVIQQPSAVMRAMAHIDPKYFANMKYLIPKHKEKWNLIKKYAPVAVIKEMGRFDTGMGTGSVEWLTQDVPKNFAEKIKAFFKDGNYRDDVFGKMPSLADEFGWIQIWNAVEKEIAKTRRIRVRSEEFYKAVAERFSEVIELTQVYDSTLSRSGIMRKTDSGFKMLTAFMAEPTTQLNMLMDATIQAKRAGGVKGVKIVAGTTGAIVASIVLNAALKSLVMAARDDDEDETYSEKYISAFTGDILSGFDILNSVPIAKDINSIFKGYDVERLDMALISDLKNAIYAMNNKEKSTTEKVMGLAGALAAFGGLPVKNVYRDIDSVFNFVETLYNGQITTKSSMKSAFMEGVAESHFIAKALIDTTKTQKLYDAMISDDEVYIERLKKQYKTEGSFNSALYKGLRENNERIEDAAHALYEGDTDTYSDLIDEIVNEGHFNKDIVVSAIKSELCSWKNDEDDSSTTDDAGGETSIYDMSDVKMFFDAEKYDAAKTSIQDIMEVKQNKYILQGVKVPDALKKAKSSMRSSMTSYYKEKYIDAYKNKDETEMLRIRKILTESGLYGSASDVRKTVTSWTKE